MPGTRRGRRLRVLLEYWLFRFCFGFLALLPLPVAMRIAALMAGLYIRLDRRRRCIGLTNLTVAFPHLSEARRWQILSASFANLGRTVAECAHLHQYSSANIQRFIAIDDEESWQRVLATVGGSGAMILTGHFGNWELFHYAHALLGYPVQLVHRPIKNPLIDRFVETLRTRAGTVVHRKDAAARAIVRALKRGHIAVLPLDQNASRRMGVFVDFFGQPASTNSGLARLALRTGVPVFPAFLLRQGSTPQHRIVVFPPVEQARLSDWDASVRETTQRYAQALERMIARYPEQWLWTHKRWRTRPPGERSVYERGRSGQGGSSPCKKEIRGVG